MNALNLQPARALAALAVALFVTLALGATTASAEEVNEDNIRGEATISMPLAFAKVLVNGESWEDHEFTGSGKKVTVRNLPRDGETKITLEPIEEGYAPAEITINPKDFKKKVKRKGRTRVVSFVAKKKVKFDKAAAAE